MLHCLVYCNAKSARMFISIYTIFHKQNKCNKQYKVQKPSGIIYITGCYLRNAMAERGVFFDIPGANPSNIRSICSSIILKLLAVAKKKWVMGTIVLWQIEKGVISIPSSYHVRMPINCHTSLAKRLFCEDRALFVHPIVHCTVDHSFVKARLSSSIFVRPSLQKQSFNRNTVYCALQTEVVCKSPWACLKYGITYMCFTNMFIYLTT